MANLIPPVVARLVADTGEYTAKMDEAAAKTEETRSRMESAGSGMGKAVTVGLLAAAAAFVATGVAATDLATKYQSSTANLAANANISVQAANSIGNAFLDQAGKTTFSASTTMQAYAGVAAQLGVTEGHALSTAQALQFMTTAQDLAEASGTALNSATADLAKTMQAFEEPAAKAGDVSNILFNVSRDTATGLDTVTQSITKARGQMGAAAPDIQDMGALLLDLTAHGETGRGAISALSSAFTGIITPSKAVTQAQKDMGVTFFNAQHQLLPISDIIGELQPKLAGMSEAQADATLKTLGFGGASAKLAEVIQAGSGTFNQYLQTVTQANSVQDAAETKANTFEGAMKKLQAAGEDLLTKLGQALLPVLTDVAKGLASAASWAAAYVVPAFEAVGTWVTAHVVPALQSLGAWIEGSLLPQLEHVGTWVWNNMINPLIHFAQIVVPPVLAAFGFIGDHITALLAIIAPVAGALAAMWAIDKIQAWGSAASTAIQGLLGKIGVGAGVAKAATTSETLGITKVWIVGSDIPMGGGLPGGAASAATAAKQETANASFLTKLSGAISTGISGVLGGGAGALIGGQAGGAIGQSGAGSVLGGIGGGALVGGAPGAAIGGAIGAVMSGWSQMQTNTQSLNITTSGILDNLKKAKDGSSLLTSIGAGFDINLAQQAPDAMLGIISALKKAGIPANEMSGALSDIMKDFNDGHLKTQDQVNIVVGEWKAGAEHAKGINQGQALLQGLLDNKVPVNLSDATGFFSAWNQMAKSGANTAESQTLLETMFHDGQIHTANDMAGVLESVASSRTAMGSFQVDASTMEGIMKIASGKTGDFGTAVQSLHDQTGAPINGIISAITSSEAWAQQYAMFLQQAAGQAQSLMDSGVKPGSARAFASGGILTEPILGIGMQSGDTYTLAENGAEAVTPLVGGGGGTGASPTLVSGGSARTVSVVHNWDFSGMRLEGVSDPNAFLEQLRTLILQRYGAQGMATFLGPAA